MFPGLCFFSLGEALAVRIGQTSKTKLHLKYSWIILVTQTNPHLFLSPEEMYEDSFNKMGKMLHSWASDLKEPDLLRSFSLIRNRKHKKTLRVWALWSKEFSLFDRCVSFLFLMQRATPAIKRTRVKCVLIVNRERARVCVCVMNMQQSFTSHGSKKLLNSRFADFMSAECFYPLYKEDVVHQLNKCLQEELGKDQFYETNLHVWH